MPVYEYCCNSCNIQFELRQKFSDPPADQCPECGGTVRKVVSVTSFSLKGAGWYGDGYDAKAEPSKSDGDTAAGAEAATAVVASTDTTQTETAAPSSTQTSTTTQVETKGTAVDTHSSAIDKADAKSTTSDVV